MKQEPSILFETLSDLLPAPAAASSESPMRTHDLTQREAGFVLPGAMTPVALAVAATSLRHPELVMVNAPLSDEVECFRKLRGDLSMGLLSPADPDPPALALVSANVGDGKTFVLSNLAVAFSQARLHTLVVDANTRAPRLHQVFDVDNRVGLSEVLSGRAEMQVTRPVSHLPCLHLLSAGTLPPNPADPIHQPSFELLVRKLRAAFDIVLVDTPAAVHGSDAATIAALCGAALVIARKGRYRTIPSQHLIGRLQKGGVKIAGVMMNNV